MVTFLNDLKLKLKYKLCKFNSIRTIAVLPSGEMVESFYTWLQKKDSKVTRDIYHENLIEEDIMKKLMKKGYKLPPLQETHGMASRCPLMVGLIREYSIVFINKSYLVNQDYHLITSYIPKEITKEQYIIISKYNKDNIDSICYDDGKDFAIIDKPLNEYIKNRIK